MGIRDLINEVWAEVFGDLWSLFADTIKGGA